MNSSDINDTDLFLKILKKAQENKVPDEMAEVYYNSIENSVDKDKIEYTDYVGLLMNSVTTIVNVIGYVLIAFVSISLIVSSIWILIW